MKHYSKIPETDEQVAKHSFNVCMRLPVVSIVVVIALLFWLNACTSCTPYKCQPSPRSKDYASARLLDIDTLQSGYRLTWRRGFKYFATDCPTVPDSLKIGNFYKI
jgi:hypothetical protein